MIWVVILVCDDTEMQNLWVAAATAKLSTNLGEFNVIELTSRARVSLFVMTHLFTARLSC
jgi:hypothetical protein